jgi:hypothetical protein
LITGLSDTSRGGTGTFIGVFSGQAVVQSTTATQSISGQMTAHVVQGGASQNLRLKGVATSETLTLFTLYAASAGTGTVGVGNSAPAESVVGPVITYTIDGWQTTSPSSSSGLSLGSGGGSGATGG